MTCWTLSERDEDTTAVKFNPDVPPTMSVLEEGNLEALEKDLKKSNKERWAWRYRHCRARWTPTRDSKF